MGHYVCSGAMLRCSMGLQPATLTVLPVKMVMNNGKPQANIMDHKPMINIKPFGLCRSLANPAVASATSAAFGTLTPMPCVPNTTSPWMMGKTTTLVKNKPALVNNSRLMCQWGGIITINQAGQISVQD